MAYMGTGDFAVPPLLVLSESRHEVVVAVSQPDRPRGRGMKTIPTPVHAAADAAGIPIWQPATLRDESARQTFNAYGPELVVVAAYGRILPEWIWTGPRLGAINIHGSLLPLYRGAAPIQRAVMNGDTVTGISVIKVAPEIDTGDMLLQSEAVIEADDTSGDVFAKLSLMGADVILEAIDLIESGRAVWRPQLGEATQAPKIDKSDARLAWSRDSLALKNTIRALNPNPGAYFMLGGRRVKVWRSAARPLAAPAEPGAIVELSPAGPVVACGSGALLLLELQPAGRAVLAGADFIRGYRPSLGAVVE